MNYTSLAGTISNRRPEGSDGIKFSLAVPRENHVNDFDHLLCISFGETAKEIALLPMSARIRLEGKIQRSARRNKQTGARRDTTEILVLRIEDANTPAVA